MKLRDIVEHAERLDGKATAGPWLEGGPYPGVSVCIQVFPGSADPDCPEPPQWEPVAILDQRYTGELNPQAVADAAFIAGARTLVPQLAKEIRELARQVIEVAIEIHQDRRRCRLCGEEDTTPLWEEIKHTPNCIVPPCITLVKK